MMLGVVGHGVLPAVPSARQSHLQRGPVGLQGLTSTNAARGCCMQANRSNPTCAASPVTAVSVRLIHLFLSYLAVLAGSESLSKCEAAYPSAQPAHDAQLDGDERCFRGVHASAGRSGALQTCPGHVRSVYCACGPWSAAVSHWHATVMTARLGSAHGAGEQQRRRQKSSRL